MAQCSVLPSSKPESAIIPIFFHRRWNAFSFPPCHKNNRGITNTRNTTQNLSLRRLKQDHDWLGTANKGKKKGRIGKKHTTIGILASSPTAMTNRSVRSLYMADLTGYLVLYGLWSYVPEYRLLTNIYHCFRPRLLKRLSKCTKRNTQRQP